MTRWEQWLADQTRARESAGLVRELRSRPADDELMDLAGNDYLGLARDPRVTEAAAAATKIWGAGAGASRLVTGTLDVHTALEEALADFMGWPAALVCSTGYHANLAVVTALADRDARIISDAHIHASLIDAARLSRAAIQITDHNDVSAVAAALAAEPGRRTLVLAESVYSVLSDAAPLVELARVCADHDALLIVDEAHGLGVAGAGGRGLVAESGLAAHAHVVTTVTLSKSLGAQGGGVLGSAALIRHLVNRARPFIYDTALAPAAAAAAHAALDVLRQEPQRPELLRRRVEGLAGSLGVRAPAGAVVSVEMASPQIAVAAQAAALAGGVRVGCFRPPSVPDGISRLRITANAGLPDAAWERACDVVRRVVDEHRRAD